MNYTLTKSISRTRSIPSYIDIVADHLEAVVEGVEEMVKQYPTMPYGTTHSTPEQGRDGKWRCSVKFWGSE